MNRIVDLSQSPAAPNSNPAFAKYRMERCLSYQEHGWMAEMVTFAVHTGSHVDAPAHRISGAPGIDQFPLERFQGEALVIDLSYKLAGEEITEEDIAPQTGKIAPDDIVLLYTGWGYKKESDTEEYIHHSPWLGGEAARLLRDQKVGAVGIDHFSIGGSSHAEAAHDILLAAGTLIFEELFLPRELLSRNRWFFFALPMLCGTASGSLVRAVAVEFEDQPHG